VDRAVNLHEIKVVGLGQACVDYLGTAHTYPPENGKVELKGLSLQCGGPASTAMVTLKRLGIECSFIGSVSDDYIGKRILKNLREKGVEVSQVKVTPGHTSQFAFICISAGGARTIFWHRGSVPPLTPYDVDLSKYVQLRVLHLDGLMIDASIEAAKQAKARGVTVVMDAGTMRKGTKELVRLVDILIASETFALPIVGKDADPQQTLMALWNMGPKEVVVTLGDKGSVGFDGKHYYKQPAFRVRAVDTTGAGDVYHGAYIYALLNGSDMPQCMRFASAAAALKCKHVGAQSGIPTLSEVEKFLKGSPLLVK